MRTYGLVIHLAIVLHVFMLGRKYIAFARDPHGSGLPSDPRFVPRIRSVRCRSISTHRQPFLGTRILRRQRLDWSWRHKHRPLRKMQAGEMAGPRTEEGC